MIHPEDRERVETAIAKLNIEKPNLEIAYRIIRPDGKIIWVERHSRAYFDSTGSLARMVGMVVDVTQRNQAEEKLLEYEKAVEGAEDMIGVIDREYRFLLANHQYLKMRNMTREQVVGRPITEVLGKEVFEAVIKPKLDECFQGKLVATRLRSSLYFRLADAKIPRVSILANGPLVILPDYRSFKQQPAPCIDMPDSMPWMSRRLSQWN